MNDLCLDIGRQSLCKHGEELCGDHVDVINGNGDNSCLIVLADGLGSGVKANILSTLTAKILSTMANEGMSIQDCVSTIAATLPVCKEREVAYSTFTLLKITRGELAEIYQYDNPQVVLFRNGVYTDYPAETLYIGGKTVLRSRFPIRENDVFMFFSDGAIHAGVGMSLNFGWERKNIVEYMEPITNVGFTAKTLTSVLLTKCNELYGGEPGDDTTVCTVRLRKRIPMNLVMGPPSNRDDCDKMMSLFFSKEGKHIVCGGTTSNIAAAYLKKPLKPKLDFYDPDIPPTAELEGADLVTEGVITINRVLEYAKDYLADNTMYNKWSQQRDGASMISRLLFEEATDINFFVGMAVNPAHQTPGLPINFNIKMQLVNELAGCLRQMGKNIKVSNF